MKQIETFTELVKALEKLFGYKIEITHVNENFSYANFFVDLEVSYHMFEYHVKIQDEKSNFATSENPQLIYDVIEKIEACSK